MSAAQTVVSRLCCGTGPPPGTHMQPLPEASGQPLGGDVGSGPRGEQTPPAQLWEGARASSPTCSTASPQPPSCSAPSGGCRLGGPLGPASEPSSRSLSTCLCTDLDLALQSSSAPESTATSLTSAWRPLSFTLWMPATQKTAMLSEALAMERSPHLSGPPVVPQSLPLLGIVFLNYRFHFPTQF